jgi:transposase
MVLSREQFDWLVAGLPWQRLGAAQPHAITAI